MAKKVVKKKTEERVIINPKPVWVPAYQFNDGTFCYDGSVVIDDQSNLIPDKVYIELHPIRVVRALFVNPKLVELGR